MKNRTFKKSAILLLGIALLAALSVWLFQAYGGSHEKRNMDGLVGWWPGDGDAKDVVTGTSGILENNAGFAPGVSGKAFNFVPPGIPKVHSFTLWGYGFQFGSLGASGRFSNPMHIRIPDRPEFHLTNAITLLAWVYPTSRGMYMNIISKWSAVNVRPLQESYGLAIFPDGRVYIVINRDGGDGAPNVNPLSKTILPLNTWTQVVGTYDGVSVNVYVNGKLETSEPYTAGIYPGNYEIGIGGTVGSAAPGMCFAPFYGRIDDVCIYNRAMAAAEIQADYDAQKK